MRKRFPVKGVAIALLSSVLFMGLVACSGDTGATGSAGRTGSDGDAGAMGPQGDPGGAGPAGEPGSSGRTGAQGISGNQGVAGIAGATGSPGVPGAPGPEGPSGAAAGFASLVASATAEDGTIMVWGAGFKSGETVLVIAVGGSAGDDMIVVGAEANDSGAFAAETANRLNVGIYTLHAEGGMGSEATAPLVIVTEK